MIVSSSITRIILATATLLTLVVSYWVYIEYSFEKARDSVLAAGGVRATQIDEAARQQMAATFRGADYLLQDVRRNLARSPTDFRSYAEKALALLPKSARAQLVVFDADGRLVEWAGAAPVSEDIGDNPVFRQVKAQPSQDRLVLGSPAKAPWSLDWSVPLMRPVIRQDGFSGAIALVISPRYLSDEMAHILLGNHDVVGVVHLPDGRYIARSSAIEQFQGSKVDPRRPYLLPDAPEQGTFIGQAINDSAERLYAWSMLADIPAVVFVGLSTADLLAPVDTEIARHRRTSQLGTAIVLLLAGGLMALSLRDVRQRQQLVRQEALYHALFEQNHSIKLLSDPKTGRILAVNSAAVAFYGYTHEQFRSMFIWEINCLTRDEIVRNMAEAKAGQRPSFLFPHRLASGEIRTVEVFSGPVQFDGTEALYSIIHDVTARYELERSLRDSENRYRTIFEMVPAGILLVNEEQQIAVWNETAMKMLQTTAEGLRNGSPPLFDRDGQIVPPERHPRVRCLTEDFHEELYFLKDAQGHSIWINVNGRPLRPSAESGPLGGVVTFTDITHALQLEETVLMSERVFEAAIEGIMVLDAKGRIIRVNPTFRDITGYSAEEVIGRRPTILSSHRHAPGFYRAILESLATKHTWEGEITNRHKEGRLYVERAAVSAITGPDGHLSGFVVLFSDITSHKRHEEEVWRRANFDTLTGLPNRTLFTDRLAQALVQSRREGRAIGLLFIDLDRFKPVNDRWGHAAGDELLRQVAGRIAETVRDEDTVARLGGDEFVVLMPVIDRGADAMAIAQRILDQLQRPFAIAAGEAAISACIGVALGRGGAVDSATLIQQADTAMYRGKSSGRSRVVLFDDRVATTGTTTPPERQREAEHAED